MALVAALLLLMRANNEKRLTPSQLREQGLRDEYLPDPDGEADGGADGGTDGGFDGGFNEGGSGGPWGALPSSTSRATRAAGGDGVYDDFFAADGNDDEPRWKGLQK